MASTGTRKIKAGALVVGNEILLGLTKDTNTVFLAESFLKRGIKLGRWVIVPDDMEQIGFELRTFIDHSFDIVVISGGMGPTHDDITVDADARALSVPMTFHEECYRRMLAKWRRWNPDRELPETSKKGLEKMAKVPQHFDLINNEEGMVEGLVGSANKGQTLIFILPGVPREYRGIVGTSKFQDYLPPGHEGDVYIKDIRFNGKESQIALFLAELQERFPDIDIGSYPQGPNSVILRVTGVPGEVDPAILMIKEEVERLHRLIAEGG
ncbi:MAG: competence/damage-inducible protein A [Thermoplasmatota archaeon]